MARSPGDGPIWSALPEAPSDARRNERRFDGPYGRAYDMAVTNRPMRTLTRRITGGRAIMGRLDELALLAYEHAAEEPLLDVPCGALSSLQLAGTSDRAGLVVGADLSLGMLEAAARRRTQSSPAFPVQLIRCDALDLPFADASFATALSTNGLHCMPDRAAYLTQLARVLRPGGLLVLSTMVDTGARSSRAFNEAVRRAGVIPSPPPTPEELDELLAVCGFVGITDLGGSRITGRCCRRGDVSAP